MENEIPKMIMGVKSLNSDTPEARKAIISLSEDILPTAIRVPTNDPNGKDNAMIDGREYITSRITSQNGTFLEKICSAMTRI